MSLSIHRLAMARVQCSRLACCQNLLFECSSEKDAVDTIRMQGWYYSGKRVLCPRCVTITRSAEA